MTVSDTAGMIRAIDALSPADICKDTCWCNSTYRTPAWAFRWNSAEPILRFPLSEEAPWTR